MSAVVEVVLGRTYEPNLWDLRKAVASARKEGAKLVFANLRAPINSDVVQIALRSRDLYLIGVRSVTQQWYEFEPDILRSQPATGKQGTPMLPSSQWIKVGSRNALSSYVALHLPKLITNATPAQPTNRYSHSANDLVAFFSRWNGNISDDFTRLRLCVLIFTICEALRFRSVEATVRNWLVPSLTSETGHWPTFEITAEMMDLARSWEDHARSGHPDVQTWLLGMPDLLIG
jgi:hypothetical protein